MITCPFVCVWVWVCVCLFVESTTSRVWVYSTFLLFEPLLYLEREKGQVSNVLRIHIYNVCTVTLKLQDDRIDLGKKKKRKMREMQIATQGLIEIQASFG